MPGVIVVALLLICAAAAGIAVAQSDSDKKEVVDADLARAQDRLAQVRGREQVLTGEVTTYGNRINALETRLAPLESRLADLTAEVTELRARLSELTAQLLEERRRLAAAEDELAQRRVLLAQRLRRIYTEGAPDPVLVLLSSGSLNDAVQAQSLLELAVDQDRRLLDTVQEFATSVRQSRDKIASARAEVETSEERVSALAEEAERATVELRREQESLSKLRGQRAGLLRVATADRQELEDHTQALLKESLELSNQIVAAQGGTPVATSTSASGFIWPVSGPITSGFGFRWGRMHQGIDVSAGTGTPIVAAAAGTVIIAGYDGGYGNLVVVDHGGGISTAYAHQNSIGVAVGQAVGQGSILGTVGSTGNSTGPHLHFEVRISGAPTDPLNYL